MKNLNNIIRVERILKKVRKTFKIKKMKNKLPKKT